MGVKNTAYRGCLLGLAVGDAMGYAVDDKSWEEICRDYGPNGLLGYDLVNGFAEVTSYTQIAAVAANGLLMGTTRGQLQGRMAPFIRYISMAVKEWGQTQHTRREPDRAYCWICRVPELRRRRCMAIPCPSSPVRRWPISLPPFCRTRRPRWRSTFCRQRMRWRRSLAGSTPRPRS